MLDQIEGANKNRTKDELMKIKGISEQAIYPWSIDVILDWSIISLAMFLPYQLHFWPLYLIAVLVVGNRQHALAVLGHEGTHYTLCRNRMLNDFITNLVCFWPLLLTINGYRRLHFIHHGNTGTKKDPELLHKKARAPQWDLPLNKTKLFFYALKDIAGYSIPDLMIILTFSRPEKKLMLVPVIIFHLISIGICIGSGFWWVPLIWYASLATTFMMFFRIRLWFEHQGTFDTQRISLSLLVAAIFAPHKIWLHWEHHRYPTVPYHKLEEARAILNGPQVISLSELISNLSLSPFLPSGVTVDGQEGA